MSTVKSLADLAYEAAVQRHGMLPRNIQENTITYSLMDKDGINLIPLGKCLENSYSVGGHPMDPTFSRTLRFEHNNDHPLLQKVIYGDNSLKVNIKPDTLSGGRKSRRRRNRKSKRNRKSRRR